MLLPEVDGSADASEFYCPKCGQELIEDGDSHQIEAFSNCSLDKRHAESGGKPIYCCSCNKVIREDERDPEDRDQD